MARSDPKIAERLDRYWDSIVREVPGDGVAGDPDLAATVRRLHALDTAPAPDPAFAEQLGQTLLAAREIAEARDRAAPKRWPSWPGPGHRRWLVGAAACATLLLSGGTAFALGSGTLPIHLTVVPAGLLRTGAPPAHATPVSPGVTPPVYVTMATPDPGTAMSLADAERTANFPVLCSRDPQAQLLGVTYLPPLTELDGHSIANPSAEVRLAYRLGGVTVTVQERRNPTPGQPLQVVLLGDGHAPNGIETHDGQQYLVTRVQAGRVAEVQFATGSTTVFLALSPPFVDWTTAQAFIASLG